MNQINRESSFAQCYECEGCFPAEQVNIQALIHENTPKISWLGDIFSLSLDEVLMETRREAAVYLLMFCLFSWRTSDLF